MKTWPALDIQQADDLVHAFLIDFNLAAIDESRFFFHDDADRDRAATALRASFPGIDAQPVDVPDEDWAARSQAALRAIRVGNLTVAPPWDAEGVGAGFSRPIVIQPSMGFGTGHHATTRLCLAALQTVDILGCSMLDVGTGSGVLAIAAAVLGAAGALGIDCDGDAIQSARENLLLNPGAGTVSFAVIDLAAAPLPIADVVTANLTGALLVRSAGRLLDALRPGGTLIVSGILAHERDEVVSAFAPAAIVWEQEEDGWVGLAVKKSWQSTGDATFGSNRTR